MAGRAMVVVEAATVAITVRDLETSGSRQAGNSRLLAMKKGPDCGQPVIISETAYYREARNTLDGMGEHEKTARWYYYSAMAHMGLGNNVAALGFWNMQTRRWRWIPRIWNTRCSCRDYRAGDSGMRADRQPMAIPMWVATTCA